MLVHHYLEGAADRSPEKVALVCGDVEHTYRALHVAAGAVRRELRALGLTRGDRVLVVVPNSAGAVVAIFAILAAGGCIVVVDPSTPPDHLAYIMDHCRPAVAIVVPERSSLFAKAEAVAVHRCPTIVVDESGAIVGAPPTTSTEPPLPLLTEDDLAAIIYTSGSTQRPKGVTLTHRSIDEVVGAVTTYLEHRADDVVLSVLQLAFGYGLLQLLVTFRSGGRLVLQKGFGFPYDVVRKLVDDRVTGFAGVPTLFALLLRLDNVEAHQFSSLRYVTNAAAAMPQSLIPQLRVMFPTTQIFLMHGQTECLRTSYLPPNEIDRVPTSVGRGMPGVDLWLEDEKGMPVAPGQTGELVVRGAGVMLGYWDDPEATMAVVRKSEDPTKRILNTRDLFRVDDEGYFHFVGRMDDIIKSRGQKVSPLEIEELLYTLPGVAEARVIGVPDQILGSAVRAEVVLLDGAALTSPMIKAFLRQRLEDYKLPHEVVFVEALPKTASGKISRRPA